VGKKILQFILFAGIGLGILWWIYTKQQASFLEQCRMDGVADADCSLIDKVWQDVKSVSVGWLLLGVLFQGLSHITRAERWGMLVDSLGKNTRFTNRLLSILVAYFANLGFPRIGEFVRAATLAKYEKLSVEKVMGTVVTDRLTDSVMMLLFMALAIGWEGDLILGYFGKQSPGGNTGKIFMMIILGIIGFVIYKRIDAWYVSGNAPNWISKPWRILKGIIEGVSSVFRLKRPIYYLFLSFGIWMFFLISNYCCMKSFGPTAHLPVSAALIVFVFSALGMSIPSPGGMGTFHAMVIAALALYGVNGNDGFSFANICFFSISIIFHSVVGIMALILLPMLNKNTSAP
jgi:glycosyltransferase 2 family protein